MEDTQPVLFIISATLMGGYALRQRRPHSVSGTTCTGRRPIARQTAAVPGKSSQDLQTRRHPKKRFPAGGRGLL
jgi:hypothetical protein